MNAKPRPKIVVLGSINMDLVLQCASLPLPGQTIMADSSAEFCGGKGANQAVAAAMAGGDVAMIGAVGNDGFADRLLENLLSKQIDCAQVRRREHCPSGTAVIAVDREGQNSIVVVANANASLAVSDVELAERLIASADILLVQLEIPMKTVLFGIQMAKQHKVRVVLDPAPAPQHPMPGLFDVDLICPNESEAETITGVKVQTTESARLAAEELHSLGAKQVAITMGESGTFFSRDDHSSLIAPFAVNAIDSTAAGDAFAGALAVHWAATDDLMAAVHFANAAGALATSSMGAQASMASQQEIEKLWSSR